MKGYSHTMVVYYRSYIGSRRSIEKGFHSYEDASYEMVKTCEYLEEEGFEDVWGKVTGERPQSRVVQEAAPQGYTHYRIVAKDMFGEYVSSLLPINEDLQAALDTMDEDLKLIDVYKVTMPFTGRCPQPMSTRLVVRHI